MSHEYYPDSRDQKAISKALQALQGLSIHTIELSIDTILAQMGECCIHILAHELRAAYVEQEQLQLLPQYLKTPLQQKALGVYVDRNLEMIERFKNHYGVTATKDKEL